MQFESIFQGSFDYIMSSPSQPIGTRDANENSGNNDDDIGGHVTVIENISTLSLNASGVNAVEPRANDLRDTPNQQDNDIINDYDALSLSTATSATSIASSLSNGESRPRSVSLSIMPSTTRTDSSSRPNSTPRQNRSTPRSRPRSNPRTRTPMRRESPLLITGRGNDAMNETATISTAISEVSGVDSSANLSNSNEEERTQRRIVAVAHDATIDDNSDQTQNVNLALSTTTSSSSNNIVATPRVGHLLSNVMTSTNRSTQRTLNPLRERRAIGLSDKQRPSHRKQRRWNNDRFVGTSSEQLHVTLQNNDSTAEQYWREFYMPNYPCEYKSEFAKLVTDDSKKGVSVRERFLKGEVAASYDKRLEGRAKKKDGMTWMERSVMSKLHKIGISSLPTTDVDQQQLLGITLFQALTPRIQSILSRSCALGGEAFQMVTVFEDYLVSLALAASKKDVNASVGYPPQQDQETYDLFDSVFSSPPKIVMKSKSMKHTSSLSSSSKDLNAVFIPTVHFYFAADESNNGRKISNSSGSDDGQVKFSSAFCRILLYAVCQFHALESSSKAFITRDGHHSSRRSSNNQGGMNKVVTVQCGALLAPSLKLSDFAY